MINLVQKFKKIRVGKNLATIIFLAIIILAGFGFADTASAAYYSSGNWASTNLLSSETVTSIDSFVYNLSAKPANTEATIQFSQNSTNWYDSAGTENASNTLTTGVNNSIDLSGLSWSGANFYYKVTFTTSDGVDTPVLDDISVIFTSNQPPDTPTNSTPTNAATGQDLDVSLTGSAYSDTESDSQTDADWQIDDDANFATPVWTRTAGLAEASTQVTTSTGTFANELAGKTELDHNTTYYWQVRYSDGVWSSWSTSTTFTTNLINTPTNSSPANEATVTTLTPLLEASAFSDGQVGHTHVASQWQVDDDSDFSSTVYDSGETASGETSRAVPNESLINFTTYYWHVRYKDSSGFWSVYSANTSFETSITATAVEVRPVFGNTTVDQGDSVQIDVQVVNYTDGSPLNSASSVISIYNPSGTKLVNGATMTYVSGSNGIYRYSYTVPSTSGSYLYEVTATQGVKIGYGASNFEVRTIAADVSSTESTVSANLDASVSSRSSQTSIDTVDTNVDEILIDTSTTIPDKIDVNEAKIDIIDTNVDSLVSNMDILIGAMIVTQSTVNDSSPSITSFDTSLTNSTDNFYNNAVLTFTSGVLDGQTRRISDYVGSTNVITLDPALTSTPANGDMFTIVKQNVRVQEQVVSHEISQASFRTDTTSRLTDIESKVDTIITNLNTVDTNLDSVLSTINSIRTSQQSDYKIELSNVSEIQAGNTYRSKLSILDFESNPVDATSTPTILIYDSTRVVVQSITDMTKLSTGVYEYIFSVSSSATAGLWESIVNIDVGGATDIIRNDYWQVTGAPAQVVINSMSDVVVPSISANTTITNEGGGAYEYQYEWCVVSSQENQCGGDDDVYYASAAKLINTGDSFNPTLTATVPNTGDYWFKVVVYYGTEASGASRTFTAIEETSSSGGGGGIVSSISKATHENIYSEIVKARQDLDLNSQKLARSLEILDIFNPAMQELLSVNILNTESLTNIQNKIADLKAVSSATRRIVQQRSVEPIVEIYMKFNSVEINFLITNPDSNKQTVRFKAFLPEEVRPEHIMDLSGLKIDYDANAGVYFVSGEITLGAKETVTRKVEMKDIWVFSDEEIQSIKNQASGFLPVLEKTQYWAQGTVLKNDIDSTLNIVLLRQEESYSSPQDHIVVYRENKERVMRAENNLEKLKDLVVQAGASRGMVGKIGGIQVFSTWGIILAIVFGFGLLTAVIFAMWRHQTALTITAMGMNKQKVAAHLNSFDGVKKRRSKKKKKQKTILTLFRNIKFIKGLVWFVVISVVAILGIMAVKFAPRFFDSQEVEFENKETIVALTTFSNGEDQEKDEEVSKLITPMLKITDTLTSWLNVRDDSALDGKVVAKVYPSEEYEYINEQNGWYQIILSDGRHGWVFGKFAELLNK